MEVIRSFEEFRLAFINALKTRVTPLFNIASRGPRAISIGAVESSNYFSTMVRWGGSIYYGAEWGMFRPKSPCEGTEVRHQKQEQKIDKDVPISCINFPDRCGDSSLFKNRQGSWNQGILNAEILVTSLQLGPLAKCTQST